MTPDRVREAFDFQSKSCEALGSPFMGRLMALFADRDWPDGRIRDRIFAWEGDLGPRAQSVPLRLAGALHALKLAGHEGLSAVYPPGEAPDDALWSAACAALVDEAEAIDRFIDSPPQTNEVRRSATLIAVGHWLAGRFDLPLRCSELGASAGLNLNWHRYALAGPDWTRGPADPILTLRPDWTGMAPPEAQVRVTDQGGADLGPLDPADAGDAQRLVAYLWPDQPDRLTLTRAAIAAAETRVDRSDAVEWLAPRLSHRPGTVHMIYSTIAWQYFPPDRQSTGTTLIEAAGETATPDTPVAWFGMENDGGARGAALTLRLWPGDLRLNCGRADFHGRWIDWTLDGAAG